MTKLCSGCLYVFKTVAREVEGGASDVQFAKSAYHHRSIKHMGE
jgi:hypothetical protein